MRHSLTWLLAVASLGACSVDSFTGDGGSDGGDEIPPVGGNEGGDGASGKDGGEGDGPALAMRYCNTNMTASNAQFCADFDIPNNPGAGFGAPTTMGTYASKFETTEVMSAPMAFEVDVPDGGTTTGGYSYLATTLGVGDAGVTTSAKLDLDIDIPAMSTTTDPLFVFSFGEVTGGLNTAFGLEHEGGWRFANQQGNRDIPITGTVPTGWTHVVVTITPFATTATGTMTIDIGGGAATATLTAVETVGQGGTGPPPPWGLQLQVGVACAQATSASSIFYDNVVVHFQ